MPRRTASPRDAGNVPPNTANALGPANAPDTATRREKKKKANAPPATPSMLVQYPYKKLRQKTNTCRSPLVCPGKEKNKSKKFRWLAGHQQIHSPGKPNRNKNGAGDRTRAIPQQQKTARRFSSIHPSIHATPEGKTPPPLTAHPAQSPPSTPHSTTWPRSCSSAASAASGRTTPPS